MADQERHAAATDRELRMAAALRHYRRVTGESQTVMAGHVPVKRQTMAGWTRTGRVPPKHELAVRQMLTDAGIEIDLDAHQSRGPLIGLHDLARAALLLRLSIEPPLSVTELRLFDELGTSDDEDVVAVASLVSRLGNGHQLGRQDGVIFRQVFGLPAEGGTGAASA